MNRRFGGSSSGTDQQASSFLQQQQQQQASPAELAAAESRAAELMQKSIVTKHPESLYTSYSNGGIRSKEERVAAKRLKKQEQNHTLSQWNGMKRYSKNMTREMRQDLELLRYRNFLDKGTSHLSSARGSAKKLSPYFELGYFTDTPKKKRRKTFADEMMQEDPELRERVEQVAKREQRRRRKVAEKATKKREQQRKNMSSGSSRGGGGKKGGRSAGGGNKRK